MAKEVTFVLKAPLGCRERKTRRQKPVLCLTTFFRHTHKSMLWWERNGAERCELSRPKVDHSNELALPAFRSQRPVCWVTWKNGNPAVCSQSSSDFRFVEWIINDVLVMTGIVLKEIVQGCYLWSLLKCLEYVKKWFLFCPTSLTGLINKNNMWQENRNKTATVLQMSSEFHGLGWECVDCSSVSVWLGLRRLTSTMVVLIFHLGHNLGTRPSVWQVCLPQKICPNRFVIRLNPNEWCFHRNWNKPPVYILPFDSEDSGQH